ncbi:RHS repeat protein [Verrucomicrobium sp. BvORR106]|uniref:RHS repeat domain-containing protein n=1 Tax=Verrucomicrobium sp. BvORR106 TaxID=1403819 RepID=UPI00056DD803|nr:RHS repeat protein [Verrucomicrobium sp. BvORR106]
MLLASNCSAQTPEAVLCAVQERRLMVEVRDRVISEMENEVYYETSDDVPAIEAADLIVWPDGMESFPQAGALDSVPKIVKALNVAAGEFYHNLQRNYQQVDVESTKIPANPPQMALPPIGRFTEENWRTKLVKFASDVEQLKTLQWPVQKSVTTGNRRWYNSEAPGSPEGEWVRDLPLDATLTSPVVIESTSGDQEEYCSMGIAREISYMYPMPVFKWMPEVWGLQFTNWVEGGIRSNLEFASGIKTHCHPELWTQVAHAPTTSEIKGRLGFYRGGFGGADYTRPGPEIGSLNDRMRKAWPLFEINQLQRKSLIEIATDGQYSVGSFAVGAGAGIDAEYNAMANWMGVPALTVNGQMVPESEPWIVNIYNIDNTDPENVAESYPVLNIEEYSPEKRNKGMVVPDTSRLLPPSQTQYLTLEASFFYAPKFTALTSEAARKTAHTQVASASEVELLPGMDLFRIHLGKGHSDKNQVASLISRRDGFGSVEFIGSPFAFELLYEMSPPKYQDQVIDPAGTPKGSFDYDEGDEFSSSQLEKSGWESRAGYLEKWQEPRLRQVRGGDVLVEVAYLRSYHKEVKFYWLADVPAKGEDGFFDMSEKTPFKTVVVSNPQAPSGAPGLPSEKGKLRVVEDNAVFHDFEVDGVFFLGDLYPLSFQSMTKSGASAPAYLTRAISMAADMPVGMTTWQMESEVAGVTSSVTMVCPNGFSPHTTDNPVSVSTVMTSGGVSRSIACQWTDTSSEPWKWKPSKVTWTGPDDWSASGSEVTFDSFGLPAVEKSLVFGKQHQRTHTWASGARATVSTLGGQQYSSHTATYASGLLGLSVVVDGATTSYTFAGPASDTPWELTEVVSPGDYHQKFSRSWDNGDQVFTEEQGWTSALLGGTATITKLNALGGLKEQKVSTTTSTPQLLSRVLGDDHSAWGQPRQLKTYRGGTGDVTVDTLTYRTAPGAAYGAVDKLVDPWGVTREVTARDWLGRPTAVGSGFDSLTMNYSNPLQPAVSGADGAVSTQYSPFGDVLKLKDTRGGGMEMNLTPGSASLTVDGRSAALELSDAGEFQGVRSGIGSRGHRQDVSAVNGGLCITTRGLSQDNTPGALVKEFYDPRGRLIRRETPAASGGVLVGKWEYHDAGRWVKYTPPGEGASLKPVTRTLVPLNGGIKMDVAEGGLVKASSTNKVEGGKLVSIQELYDDSSTGAAALVPVIRTETDPATGVTKTLPWGIEAASVTSTAGAPAVSSSIESTANGTDDKHEVVSTKGRPTRVYGKRQGVDYDLSLNYEHDRLIKISGTMGGRAAELHFNAKGEVSRAKGPGYDKTFQLNGAPGFNLQIADSVQGTNQTLKASSVGDLTERSGDVSEPLAVQTNDLSNGLREATYNSSLTMKWAADGSLLRKDYAGGTMESTVNTYDEENLLQTSGTGSEPVTLTAGEDALTETYYGDAGTVDRTFYKVGLLKTVRGSDDRRDFKYERLQLSEEKHVAGSFWNGAILTWSQDAQARNGGYGVNLPGSSARGFGRSWDESGRPAGAGSQTVGAIYTYDEITGEWDGMVKQLLGSSAGARLTTVVERDGLGRVTGYNTTNSQGEDFHYEYTYNQRNQRTSRVASNGVSWYNIQYDDRGQFKSADISDLVVGGSQSLAYAYDGRNNRHGTGGPVTFASNGVDQVTGRELSYRGYGVHGAVAPGSTVRVFHPQAGVDGEEIYVNPETGTYGAYWTVSGDWAGTGVTRVELLVRGSKAGAGIAGTPAVADKQMWVLLPPSQETYEYDGAGRMVGDATWAYTWNGMGCLVKMERKADTGAESNLASEVITFKYDADRRRIKKERTLTYSDSTPTRVETSKMIWSGWLPACEELSVNGGTASRRWFVWGRDVSGTWDGAGGIGGLVAIEEEGGRRLLVVDDGLGNITALINQANGDTVAKFDYTPFGGAEGLVRRRQRLPVPLSEQVPRCRDRAELFWVQVLQREAGTLDQP